MKSPCWKYLFHCQFKNDAAGETLRARDMTSWMKATTKNMYICRLCFEETNKLLSLCFYSLPNSHAANGITHVRVIHKICPREGCLLVDLPVVALSARPPQEATIIKKRRIESTDTDATSVLSTSTNPAPTSTKLAPCFAPRPGKPLIPTPLFSSFAHPAPFLLLA